MEHIAVCICTWKRPDLLRRLLDAVCRQDTGSQFTFACTVVDNDSSRSAQPIAAQVASRGTMPISYVVEPERNFAAVRNRAIDSSSGEFVAFIDDDEVPEATWLLRLYQTVKQCGADGALGPVRPYFDVPPPAWILKSKICERPAHPTGLVLHWRQTRTGNVLLRRRVFESAGIRFDPAFRTGGEDVDFFKRAMDAGCRFVWCEEAPAFELVPPERLRRLYHLKRALLQGGISLKYSGSRRDSLGRMLLFVRTTCALGAYTFALPFILLRGAHLGMKYLIKMCHHLGRLSAAVGFPLVDHRDF